MALNKEVQAAQERLKQLYVQPFPLMGCPRRNRWSKRGRRFDLGVAVMLLLGQRVSVTWDGGVADVFLTKERTLLMWRPGPWRDWWSDDAELLCGMVYAHTSLGTHSVLVLHEVDGITQMRYLDFPVPRMERTYQKLNADWLGGSEEIPPRINRRSERAKIMCPRCPVRQRCEAMDRVLGKTADWQ